jgi:predicted O-linked N-acetylglucosamine transferase (SPINDLY family)
VIRKRGNPVVLLAQGHKSPDRKVRIGYVSPDFRDHAVSYFFEFMLKWHDGQQFETFAYSGTIGEDHVTARLKLAFDHWRDIKPLSDDAAADLIEADAIDILIDLAGHTANNRLLVFARKPAPVQVTWLGYPATTGMKAIDYRITDRYAEPVGMTEHLNVETLWRLPEVFCCYGARENSPDVIDHPPFEDNGYVTFGCFNNFVKVTDPVLEAWARVMAELPDSRLLLEIADIEGIQFRASIEERLKRLGIPLDRLILEPRKRSNQFVLYNSIDIALDPFPCAGGATSMDTVWMGVPFVTLAGEHFASRMGVTILTNAGMPELIAKNIDEYVQLATDLALDKDRLRGLRHNLRQKVRASPLMNQESFTRNMEAAYRKMWWQWCNES